MGYGGYYTFLGIFAVIGIALLCVGIFGPSYLQTQLEVKYKTD